MSNILCVFDKERERGKGGSGIQPLSTANWRLLPHNIDGRNTLPLTLTVKFMLVINTRVQPVYPSFTILQLGFRFSVPTWCIFVAF
jgi:hypothetical protein